MATVVQPRCLHVPELINDASAHIYWKEVPDAVAYEVEYSANEPFETAFYGNNWEFWEEKFLDWQEQDNTYTWLDIEQTTPFGHLWDTMDSKNNTWDMSDSAAESWDELLNQPTSFLIYRGPGVITASESNGATWERIESKTQGWGIDEQMGKSWRDLSTLAETGYSWAQVEGIQLCWNDFELLPEGEGSWNQWEDRPSIGWSWNEVGALHLDWDIVDTKLYTWNQWDVLPADTGRHVGTDITVSEEDRWAQLRVRAVDESGCASSWHTTNMQPVHTKINDEIAPTSAPVYALIAGGHMRNFDEGQFILQWDDRQLTPKQDKNRLPSLVAANTTCLQCKPNEACFECRGQLQNSYVYSGPLAVYGFSNRSQRTAPIHLNYYNRNQTTHLI